jgi:hypothetical protein
LTGDNTYLLQGFDALPDFSQNLPSWTLIDTDQSLTWQWEETNFPSEGNALSWIVFNPAQTIPPITEVLPVSGSKYLLCPAALNPPNSDWLISPPLQIGCGYHLSFSARSWTADYGLERLRLLISISDSLLSSFSPLSAEPWLSLPANWTTCNYDLSAYAGQRIFLAWQGVSWDAFALCLDEIRITGSVVNQDETQAILSDIVIYPNPAHDQFIVKSISKQPFELTIYNLKGQRLETQKGLTEYVWTKSTGRNLPTGVYLIKTERSGRHWVQKLVVY